MFVCAPPLPCRVGMMFIPNDDALEAKCKEIFEKVAKAENFKASRLLLALAAQLARTKRACQLMWLWSRQSAGLWSLDLLTRWQRRGRQQRTTCRPAVLTSS